MAVECIIWAPISRRRCWPWATSSPYPSRLQIFAGGALGWLIAIPWLSAAGVEATAPVQMAYEIWSTKVRYLGVGAMVVGGVSSIWTVRRGLLAAIHHLVDLIGQPTRRMDEDVTSRNISSMLIVSLGMACVVTIAGIYYHLLHGAAGLTLLTTALMLVMSFFFAAVASYIVGLVGNSNSPVSGMTITALLGTGGLILLFGFGGTGGIAATLGVAGVVCCVACTSGDVCNDLKTGYLVGASPRNQQIMQILGVVVAAFVMAPVMTVLHEGSLRQGTGGIGGVDLPAPQAGLFAALAKGFFSDEGALPKDMVAWGIAIGILLLVIDFALANAKSSVSLARHASRGRHLSALRAFHSHPVGRNRSLVGQSTRATRKRGAGTSRRATHLRNHRR